MLNNSLRRSLKILTKGLFKSLISRAIKESFLLKLFKELSLLLCLASSKKMLQSHTIKRLKDAIKGKKSLLVGT
jgi:hypothetical protein